MLSAKQTEAITKAKAELKAIRREADYLDRREDYETAMSLHRAADFILSQLELIELLALPATDDQDALPLAA
jgi:hypothetical protein